MDSSQIFSVALVAMDSSQVVTTALIAIFGGAGASIIAGYFARPKTTAEANNLEAAATVSMSAEARQWAAQFAEQTRAAEARASAAERHADEAEEKAEAAETHANALETRVDELDAALVECYGYVRKLHDQIRLHKDTPIAAPARLERMWNSR